MGKPCIYYMNGTRFQPLFTLTVLRQDPKGMFTYHFVNFQVNIPYIPSVWELDQWMDGWPTVNFSGGGGHRMCVSHG